MKLKKNRMGELSDLEEGFRSTPGMKRNSGELASPEERCHFYIRANLRRRLRAQTLPCELLDYGIQVLIKNAESALCLIEQLGRA